MACSLPCIWHCVLSIASVAPWMGYQDPRATAAKRWELVGSSHAKWAAGLRGEQRDWVGLLLQVRMSLSCCMERQGVMLPPRVGPKPKTLL